MGILDFIQEELAKTKKSLGLIGGIKLANDPKVKELSDFERKMYEKSLIYKSMKDAVTAPGRAYKGELDPWSHGAVEEAMNVAGMATLGGFPGGARGPGSVGSIRRPRNALGQEIPPTPYELAHAEAQRVAAILAQPNEAKAK